MSGPVSSDEAVEEPGHAAGRHEVEITASRGTEVGGHRVRRALPRRTRRTVGPWCFADHMGPASVDAEDPFGVGPHPHIGLQTVTWLVAGSLLHRDSLGTEQMIRPGQLNLMTAGRGVAHAEEGNGSSDTLHGIQLWVAQPEATRHGEPEFEHRTTLPQVDVGAGIATVLVGSLDGGTSPARRDTESIGVDLDLRPGEVELPLEPAYEHAIVLLDGSLQVDGETVVPGQLCYLGAGRDELGLTSTETTRGILLGGVPFESPILMWWNFVARTRDEIDAARTDWAETTDRFARTGSVLAAVPAPETPWRG